MEIDHKIICTAILSLPMIQERQLSVTGENMCKPYENTPIQYDGTFFGCKNEKFQM